MHSEMTPLQASVFEIIEKAANASKPAPSNAEIAEQLHVRPDVVGNVLGHIRTKNMIKLERYDNRNNRVFTICATGKTTQLPCEAAVQRQAEIDAAEETPVPCWRCGCRKEACGC